MDNMQLIDLSIMHKFLEFAEVTQWAQTRQLMFNMIAPYLKNKKLTVSEYFPLPTDENPEQLTTEISNQDVEWYKEFINKYKNKESK